MQILVVDDSALVRDMVTSIVVNAGYPQPLLAKDAREAKAHIKRSVVDLILMDIQLPGVDGLQLTRQIRRNLKDEQWIPIIFLTIKDDPDYLAAAIDAGGDDYLVKPVNPVVLLAKVHAMARISNMKAALDETNLQLNRLTQIDALTNVINRRGFDESLMHSWRLHRRNDQELCLLFLDIDDFKTYNDNYGHPQGTAVCVRWRSYSKPVYATRVICWLATAVKSLSSSCPIRLCVRRKSSLRVSCLNWLRSELSISIHMSRLISPPASESAQPVMGQVPRRNCSVRQTAACIKPNPMAVIRSAALKILSNWRRMQNYE
nr:response regulator [Aliamphritea spongicola]